MGQGNAIIRQGFFSTAITRTLLGACVGLGLSASVAMAGGDTCSSAAVTTIVPGPPGTPAISVFSGDLTAATGPDCDVSSGDAAVIWWEAFELTRCGDVVIELCGSTPLHFPSRNYLYSECGAFCSVAAFANTQNRQNCADNNITMTFSSLPPGIYYYPLLADPNVLTGGVGTYQMTVSAQQCSGACCDFDTGTCDDAVLIENCSGPNQQFHSQQSCCSVDCVAPGQSFGSFGVELLGQVPLSAFTGFPSDASDIWGYASPSGREYALIGLSNQTAFVEVTDPFHPVVIDRITGANCIWRDIRTVGTYAYIVTDCSGGMDIVDLSQIDAGHVDLVRRWNGLSHAHNVITDETSGFAYVVSSTISQGIAALNLSNPGNPTVAGAWSNRAVHDAFVHSYTSGPYAGREIAFCFAGGDGLAIVDVTNKAAMVELAILPYPNISFAHQGWLTPDERYVIFGDEGDEFGSAPTSKTYVVDVQDLQNPTLVNIFTNGICSIDHNLIIRGGLTYAANYSSGLRVFDTSDVLNISEVAYFDTFPNTNFVGFVGAWGVYPNLPSGVVLISDIERGLFVLNYDCNGNGIDDTIDIATGFSQDINGNGVPDECEFDCNGNGIPDDFEILITPSLDSNADGVIDSCQCPVQAPPELLVNDVAKSRYLSINPSGSGSQSAIRVTLEDVAGYPGANGRTLWVGPPRSYREEDSSDPTRRFTGAALQCEPYFQDWSTISELHVYGAEMVPGSRYQVHAIDSDCLPMIGTSFDFGAPLAASTSIWADMLAPFFSGPDDIQPDFKDISGIVAKFLGDPAAPIKAATQMQPNIVNPTRPVDFKDIASAVASFLGSAFSDSLGITGPCECPSTVTCGTVACVTDNECGNGFCIDDFCTDSCGRCAP